LKVFFTILLLTFFTQILAQELPQQADSLHSRLDSVRNEKISKIDSAELKLNTATGKIQDVNHSLTDYDTLIQKIPSAQAELDKQKNKVRSKMDSLKILGQPNDKYARKLDSLNSIDPLSKLRSSETPIGKAEEEVNGVENKISDAQSKVNNVQQAPQSKVNEKLNVLSSESNGMGTLPSNVDLPGANVQGSGMPKIGTDEQGLPSTGASMPDLKGNALDKDLGVKIDMPAIEKPGELEKLGDVQQKVDDNLGKVTTKASGYGEDVKNISSGNIDQVKTMKEDALVKSPVTEEMNALKQGDAAITEQKAALQAAKNKEAYRKQVTERGREMALKSLASQELAIQKAVQKVNKYHSKAGTILQRKKDLPKRRDPLSKLRFYQKFVPGVNFQLYKTDAWMVDLNPSLRYRLTSYWSVGSGWDQRYVIGNSTHLPYETKVYGLRTFSEVVVFKGISVRLDAERMNSFVTPLLTRKDEGVRKWEWYYFAGLKKEFTFVKRVTGNVQFMYNVYRPGRFIPYPNRFNVRFGFEYNFRKKLKKKIKDETK
jgi:hypothetical protein